MEVVIDSNKVISAAVSKGIVRRIVVFSGINFRAPKVLVDTGATFPALPEDVVENVEERRYCSWGCLGPC